MVVGSVTEIVGIIVGIIDGSIVGTVVRSNTSGRKLFIDNP